MQFCLPNNQPSQKSANWVLFDKFKKVRRAQSWPKGPPAKSKGPEGFKFCPCTLGWALQREVAHPNLYQLFFCCHWSIIRENIWVYRFRIDFEVSVIFFVSQCKIQGKIDAQIYFGHNFWQEGPTDLRSTPLSYIFDALFRDTPIGHVCRTQPNIQIFG